MIARLTGEVVARDGHRVIVDVGGVGYAVSAPVRDAIHWSAAGGPVVVHVHTEVREDAILLFGFASDADRVAFETLRGVTGVGPTTALHALDTLGLDTLIAAVEGDDVRTLARIPKVGAKLASRMALELKGKLRPGEGTSPGPAAPAPAPSDDTLELALGKLGYTRAEVARAREGLASQGIGPDTPVAQRLRVALAVLSGRGEG